MYISNNITKPLKMTKTNHLLQANTKHYNIKDNNPLSQKLLNERSFAGPSGSLKSNISDMIKFANIHLFNLFNLLFIFVKIKSVTFW